jgi:hypothetical protein
MTTNISTAQTEYYRRPADERMPDLQGLLAAATERKATSREINYNAKDLRVVPVDDAKIGRIQLASPKGAAELTPWSHAQLCRFVGAPAAYIRTLPADIAADALNHGLQTTSVGTTANILAQAKDGQVTARSVLTETYGRLWEADLYRPIADTFGSKGWTTPPTWDGKPAGAYMSDRDSFLIVVDGGSIVTDPSLRSGQDGRMFRGLMIRNSEVGLCAVSIERVLFEFICGNHMLWGAVIDRSYRRRHVGTRVLRDVLREIGTTARQWIDRPASADEALIRSLMDLEVAQTREAVIDELRAMGASLSDAQAAYATCEQQFDASPRSFWGLSQGLTKASQETGYQDERLSLDVLAAKLLAKGRARVAA